MSNLCFIGLNLLTQGQVLSGHISVPPLVEVATNPILLQSTPLQQSSAYSQADSKAQLTSITQLAEVPTTEKASGTAVKLADSHSNEPIAQFTSVSQLSDVRPTDWAFQALQSLVQRYGVTADYPDSKFSSNRTMTRYEFAAELQALLDALNQSVGIKTAESLTPEELATLQRLQTDFATELNRLNRRAELLETRTTQVEDRQFSPTTTLSGEVIVALSGDFGDNTDGNLALQQRTKLSFRSSFNGKDRLTVSFSGGNFERFSYLGRITNEGRLGFDTNTDNALRVSTLSYRFPLGKNARILVAARGDDVSAVNPIFSDRGTGSISRFGRKNPVYRLVESGGIGFRYRFSDLATLGVGYFSGEREDRNPGDGLFNGDYSTALRLKLNPTDRILLGLLYINTYSDSDLKTGTGSLRSQVDLDRSVVGNSYSLETSFRVSPKFVIGGWAGFTDAIVLGLGDAHVWNYALTFAFLDLGKEGNLLGFIIGQEPRLTGTSGFTIDGRRSDPDISLHIEALYRYQVRNNLSITPGLIWITAPNHDNNNGDIFVVTVRTTFEF